MRHRPGSTGRSLLALGATFALLGAACSRNRVVDDASSDGTSADSGSSLDANSHFDPNEHSDAGPDTGSSPDSGVPSKWPDSSNTGWQHTGVTLREVPSQVTSGAGWSWEGPPFNYVKISGDNALLDSLDIAGCVYIEAAQTTIKRSKIRCAGAYMIRIAAGEGAGLVVEDTELDGLGGGAVGIVAQNARLTRLDVHGFTGKGVMNQGSSILEYSYIHGNVCVPPDHQSGVGTNGGASAIVIRFNHVDLIPTDCTSGGISNYDDFGAFHDVRIEGNLINSAGYCLKAGFEDGNAAGNSGMRVINNVFGRKYNPQCGVFGAVSNWMPGVSGNEWTGNTWGEGGAADPTHSVGDPVSP